MFNRKPHGQRGITLIEIMLVVALITAAVAATFVFTKKARVVAAVETEQRQFGRLAESLNTLFATQSDFSGLSTDGAAYFKGRSGADSFRWGKNDAGNPTLLTNLGNGGGTLTFGSADVLGTNDGIVIHYRNLYVEECSRLVPAILGQAHRIEVVTGPPTAEVKTQVALRHDMTETPDRLAELCASDANKRPGLDIVLLPSRANTTLLPTVAPTNAACQPTRETQQLACPAGQVGVLTQERDGTCTGPGNSLVFTGWTTIDTTCQAAPVTPPNATTTPPPATCLTTTFTQSLPCPLGLIGQIVQSRDLNTCTATYTPWSLISSSCAPAPVPATCTPQVQNQIIACPAGQGGQQTQARTSTCPSPSALPVWGGWSTVSNNCRATCLITGTCCVVQRQTQTASDICPAGQYGSPALDQERFLGCVNPTTQSGSWTPWVTMATTGICTACPSTTTETEQRWDPQSAACPVGFVGAHTFEVDQVRTRDRSYACPAGTVVLPAPGFTVWSAWVNTGNPNRNDVNTCAAATCPGAPSELRVVAQSAPCPAGFTGTHTWDQEQSRSRTCTTPPMWDAWSGWANTATPRQNEVNTCVPSACSPGTDTNTRLVPTSAPCPSGYIGVHTWDVEEIQTRVCLPGPTWSGYGSWGPTGNILNEVNTCALPATNGCWDPAAGYYSSGTADQYSPFVTIDWSFGGNVGSTTCSTSNMALGIFGAGPECSTLGASDAETPARAAFATEYGAQPFLTGDCDVGDDFWVHDERDCNKGFFGGLAYCSIVDYSVPCTPKPASGICPATGPACNVAVGQVFNWTVGGEACTYAAAAGTSISNGMSYTATDVTPAEVGTAGFLCSNGVMSASANPGATCSSAAPVSCPVPAGTVFNWNVGVNNCDYVQVGATTVPLNSDFGAVDGMAPTTGAASFACDSLGNLSMTAKPGMTCTTAPPPPCSIPANTDFNWTQGGNSCTYRQVGATTVPLNSDFPTTDSTAPATGNAAFTCNAAGVMSMTAKPGATCTVPPANCPIPSGTVFNWTVGGNLCTYQQATNTSVALSSNFGAADITAPTTGNAAFACSAAGVLSMTANAGASCNAAPTTCAVPAGTTFRWKDGATNTNDCEFTQVGATTIPISTSFAASDITAPATGAAGFACDAAGVLSATANPGATCVAGCAGGYQWAFIASDTVPLDILTMLPTGRQLITTMHPLTPASIRTAAAAAKASAVATPPALFPFGGGSEELIGSSGGTTCSSAADAGNVVYTRWKLALPGGPGMDSGGGTPGSLTETEFYRACVTTCDAAGYEPGVCATTNDAYRNQANDPITTSILTTYYFSRRNVACPAPLSGTLEVRSPGACADKNGVIEWDNRAESEFGGNRSCTGSIGGSPIRPDSETLGLCPNGFDFFGSYSWQTWFYKPGELPMIYFTGQSCTGMTGKPGYNFYAPAFSGGSLNLPATTSCFECAIPTWAYRYTGSTIESNAVAKCNASGNGIAGQADNVVRISCPGFSQTGDMSNAGFNATVAANCACDASKNESVKRLEQCVPDILAGTPSYIDWRETCNFSVY